MAYCIRTSPAINTFLRVRLSLLYPQPDSLTSDSPGSAPARMDESNSSDPFMTLSPDTATSPRLPPTYNYTKLMFTDPFQECLSLDSSDDGYQKRW